MKVRLPVFDRLQSYLEWIRRWGCLPVPAWIEGSRLYQKGEFQKAAEFYKQGLASHPRSRAKINALLDLSHCLFRLQQFDQAEMYLRQATSSFPDIREGYLRLARLQLWLGYSSEALWTMRLCIQRISVDPELVALFINSVVESGGNDAEVQEANSLLRRIHYEAGGFPGLEVARARLLLASSQCLKSRGELSKLAALDRGPFDAVVAYAEVLIGEGKLAYARHHLHRALAVAPEHPKVLRLLALTYLHEGALFEADYAVQLAVRACQVTGWRGIHELYILAQAYVAQDDKLAALMTATRAKTIASRLIGGHPGIEKLERYLQSDSIGSPV